VLEKYLAGLGAPNWVICEVCKGEGPLHRQARFVIAENEPIERASPELPELVLLCGDCSAVANGEIDASEWKRRKVRCA
jgi:hypothetical protein